MRKKKPLSPRYVAVKQLQEKLASLEPGTKDFELYNLACDLAINPERMYNEYFMYNVLREARRVLSRKPELEFVSINRAKLPIENLVKDHAITYNRGPENHDHQTLINTITFICEHAHPRGKEVLVCMLDDCDINTTAGRTGMSLSLAKKITSRIKKQVNLKFNN
jgi:hypothetical protein